MENEKLVEQLDLKLDGLCEIVAQYRTSRRRRNGQYFFIIRDYMASQVYDIQQTMDKIINKRREK